MKIKNIFVGFLIIMLLWFLFNNSLDLDLLLIGLGVSLLSAIVFCSRCDIFQEVKFSFPALLHSFLYVFVFLFELIKSNFDVARRVLSPSLPINPGIVEVKTKLKSKIARVLLTNSITLTPGTISVDINDDIIIVHWINVKTHNIEEATKKIVEKFEKHLIKIYA
jgi:multicomponent Na+:H+ antiporter subunit E